MRGVRTVVAVIGALLLSACGGGDGAGTPADVATGPPRIAEPGPFTGECGHVTDAEIQSITTLSAPSDIFRNSVTCRWFYTGQSTDVTFVSYRGSPIERERAWEVLWGRQLDTIEIAGRSGFLSYTPDGVDSEVCVLALGLGDDFFEWSYRGRIAAPRASCDMIRRFAELTVERLR
ncbi:DUF3558 domain-containing protein [Nocardia sp. NPDC050406]|uniref:DUF3558 domain-containing protein n=1 Tax=Nocardia sp. NPDC050406 TaxID=3364318 RepID=UPI0037B80DB2